MPKVPPTIPDTLRPYLGLGVDLTWRQGRDDEAIGNCPICERDGRFSVSVNTGQYRCLKCNESGNATLFVRWLWEASFERTTTGEYTSLTADRGIEYPETFMAWGVAKSVITEELIIPGYSAERKVMQLYTYAPVKGGRRVLRATATLKHGLFGLGEWNADKPIAYICEGPWDGMALWERLVRTKAGEDSLRPTSNQSSSLLAEANVVAVPGCTTFATSWAVLFGGKVVNILFDNDHPRTDSRTGKVVPGAGWTGTQRVAKLLRESKTPPEVVNYYRWGERGYNPDLPSGYDVRDLLS